MNYSKKYSHIDKNQRFLIENLRYKNFSIREIASILHVSPSTISRELKRNSDNNGNYLSDTADIKAKNRAYHKYMFRFNVNFIYRDFTDLFCKKYNKYTFGVKATYQYISKYYPVVMPSLKTVFQWIKTNQWSITRKDRLRQYYKKGGKRQSNVVKRLIPQERVLPIWARPKYIDLREEFGHWEADLIIGKKANGFKNLVTFTERKTRYGISFLISNKNPMKLIGELYKHIKKHNLLVNSITFDNGIEFEKVGLLANWLDIYVYKAEPYASFQRGSNEHFNGLIRRKYKKGFDFNLLSEEELNEYIDSINNMPREILGWKTSKEVFQRYSSVIV